MPVTEVQWIGSSCGRHSSYTFYRGFRLIVDGNVKNYCLGEFYFVRNSANQPICIAELQLVWHDSSTDSQLASARLYFRPEDTPAGRLPWHGQDELLYADQKVVIKCHDMADWQDTGDEWTSGLIPLCESDFDCTGSKYCLKNSHTLQESQHLAYNNKVAWLKEQHSRKLYILTFPAYCRYRALRKRLQDGASFTRTQIIALGGVIADHKNTRVLFCRNCFHHPYLDKFELSGETKAPVLKGRPRKKKRLHGVPNSVLSKKRFVADIQNHLASPATKKSKFSEEDEGTESDISEGVLEKIRSLPQAVIGVQNKKGPPPLVKPKIPAVSTERTNVVVKKVVGHDVSHRQKIPPPLIPSHKVKGEVPAVNPSQARSNQRQNELTVNHCGRNSSLVQLKSSEQQANDVQKTACHPSIVTSKSALAERIQAKVNAVSVISSATDAVVTSTKHSSEQNSAGLDNYRSQPVTAVPNSQSVIPAKLLCNTQATTQPAISVQAGICNKLVTSTRPVVRVQPLAPKPSEAGLQPVKSDTLLTTSLQSITTQSPACSVTSSQHMLSDGIISSSSTDAKHVETSGSETNAETFVEETSETRQPRPRSDAEKTAENEVTRVEPIVWKKKKRLRMPGNIKDEEYQDEDEKYFMQSLRDFMKSRNTPLGKIPALGFKKVNLWTMYTTAQRFGGYDAVTSKRMWRRVYDSLGGSTTITSAATYTRRHYERLLLPYEKYIRSQLKDKVDKKVSTSPHLNNKLVQREPSNLSAKQVKSPPVTVTNSTPDMNRETPHSVTVTNNKPETSRHHQGAHCSTVMKVDQPDLKTNTATVPFRNSIHTTMNVGNNLRLVDQKSRDASTTSGPGQGSVTAPEDVKISSKPDLSHTTPTPSSQQSEETRSQNGKDKFWAADTRTKVATNQQNVDYHYGPFLKKDDQSSARTSVVYTKSLTAGTFHGTCNSPKEAQSGHRGSRRQNIEKVQLSPATLVDEVGKAREVIDLTLDDSLPQIDHSPSLGFGSQESLRKKSEESELIKQRVSSQWRDTGQLQGYAERHPSASRHCSVGVSIKSVDVPSAQGMESYSPPHSPKMPLQMQEFSRAQTIYKGNNEKYSSNKYEESYHAQDRMVHPLVETMYRSTAHSSLESGNEHFAEWHHRRSSLQPQQSGHRSEHLRKPHDHEVAHLRYTYLNEGFCDQDCACSAPKKRKDSTLPHQPHVKKEHYEDDIPFSGMHVYPTSWTPPVVADHPDLFISSHPSHMQGSPDALASHMCTASRIFLPQAQIFSSPYHMGMAPMGAPPLLTGTDDQLHIHPHCLISSPYPCTSNSRASDSGGYPLYSFT